jgi:1-acyl-sn-glycerol-3-phosphate acyltransferase
VKPNGARPSPIAVRKPAAIVEVTLDFETRAVRWKRRARTIPMMLGATAAAVCLLPLVLLVVGTWDVVRFRWRLPSVRLSCFVVQYMVNDTVEILLAAPLWLASGCGLAFQGQASRARYERVQAWSIRLLARRARQLLGIRFDIDPAVIDALVPGPAIVLCHHASVLDAALPSLLYQTIGFHTRGVVMAELLADPGFDLIYQHAGSVFIGRDNDPDARARVAAISTGLDSRTVAVIFPEGRLFRPHVLQRALARLGERDPERAARLAHLEHVLPPRPGGVDALLDNAPGADVVVIKHALDQYPTLEAFWHRLPLKNPVAVAVERVPRTDIPADPDARAKWLDQIWIELDEWLHDHHADATFIG